MRIAICCLSLLTTSFLAGCGQTGALQLPNDPNSDKRAQYLLYKEGEQANKSQSDQPKSTSTKEDVAIEEQADRQTPVSETINTN